MAMIAKTATRIVIQDLARVPNHIGSRARRATSPVTGSGSPCSLVRASGPSDTWSMGTIWAATGSASIVAGDAGAWHNQHLDASEPRREPHESHRRIRTSYPRF